MQVERTDAEVSQHPRSRHHQHAGVLQGPECLHPLDDFEGHADEQTAQELRQEPSGGPPRPGLEIGRIPIRHLHRGDAVLGARLFGAGADAVHRRTGEMLADAREDRAERRLVSKVLRAEVSEEADRPLPRAGPAGVHSLNQRFRRARHFGLSGSDADLGQRTSPLSAAFD